MPCLGSPEHDLPTFGKTVLENIDINGGVIEQLSGPTTGRIDESKS